MAHAENQLLHQFQKNNSIIEDKYYLGDLENKYADFDEKRYQKNEFKFLQGKEAGIFWNKIKALENAENEKIWEEMLGTYKTIFYRLMSQIT